MRKVLIIAYYFPPENFIGSLRPMGLATYLPQFGWEPIVLTTKLKGLSRDHLRERMKIYEVPAFDITCFLQGRSQPPVGPGDSRSADGESRQAGKFKTFVKHKLKTIFAFPDRNNGWYGRAMAECDRIFSENSVECVLSTSSPWTSALVARSVKTKYDVPWIADFRDLWTQNHRYDYIIIRKFLERALEKWTLKKADTLVMVSDKRAEKWKALHPGKRIVPITLGFNSKDFKKKNISSSDKFTIIHAGKVKGKQSPEPLFKAVSQLITEDCIPRDRIKIIFYGEVPIWVKDSAGSLEISDIVEFKDIIPREEIIPKLMGSSLQLLLNWNDPDEPGIHPGKLFDYLGAKVPILAVGDYPDVVTDVLRKTRSGEQFMEIQSLKKYLWGAFDDFRKNGRPVFRGIEKEIDTYSYRAITARFADELDAGNKKLKK